MFLLMLLIGLRRSLFPKRKEIPVTRLATAIGTRLLCRFFVISPKATPGFDTMSPRLISLAPCNTIVDVLSAPTPLDSVPYARSVSPVIIPQGDVPATPSDRMLAYV